MTATVKKNPAPKSTAARTKKAAPKPAASGKAKPVNKAAAKPTSSTSLGKSAKASSNGVKATAKKSVAKTAKTDAKSPKTVAKASAKKPVAKPAPKTETKKTSVKSAVKSGTAKKTAVIGASKGDDKKGSKNAVPAKMLPAPSAAKVAKQPSAIAEATEGEMVKSGMRMSNNNAITEFTTKIERTVVSKVSEVATKTSKSTPTVETDGSLLTEEQILKMSEKDYMNPAQLAFFKARLQQLERDLLKNAGETTEHLRETVLVPDPADRATIEEEHALELRTRDRERKLLKKVQQSLASIESGDYGWCEETGEPIGIPRLLARPTATLSLEAQQRRELKQKLYGD